MQRCRHRNQQAASCWPEPDLAARSNAEVERLLTEVIKRVPNLAEPYQTLGTVCLEAGEPKRALNFLMIAAHLTPKDVHQWRRLAGLSTQQGYLRQAIYCLSKARTLLCLSSMALCSQPAGRYESSPSAVFRRACLHATTAGMAVSAAVLQEDS
jgi:tetratricopeptide (TPR) repeat protein